MTKQSPRWVTKRRLLLSSSLFILFLIYLAFDIDFLIAFKIDNDAVEIFEQPKLILADHDRLLHHVHTLADHDDIHDEATESPGDQNLIESLKVEYDQQATPHIEPGMDINVIRNGTNASVRALKSAGKIIDIRSNSFKPTILYKEIV